MIYLVKYWKYVLVVALVVGAFLGGRFLTPEKIVIKERVVNQTVTAKVEQKQETNEKIVYVDRPVDRVVTKTVVREPTGKVTETTTDATHTGNTVVTTDTTQKTQIKTVVEQKLVYKDRVIEKETFTKWTVSASAGYAIGNPGRISYIPKLPPRIVIGASVLYSVNKTIQVGPWVTSDGVVGGQLNFKF